MLKTYRFSQFAYFALLPLVAGTTVLMGEAAQADVAIANGIDIGTGQLYAQSYSTPLYIMHSRPPYIDRSDSDWNRGDWNRGDRNSGNWNDSDRDYRDRDHNRHSGRDFSDRTTEDAILINPVLINPVIINPSGQTAFQSPYYRPSMPINGACTLFVELRPACQ
jgi:hypothetical protein